MGIQGDRWEYGRIHRSTRGYVGLQGDTWKYRGYMGIRGNT